MRNLVSARGRIAKTVIAVSLALSGGLGTFAVAHAATASPSASASPSTSASPGSSSGSSGTTHNCPNM
ncbi:MAG: hypothetical protein E6I07_13695 [Chloroflexi bacterium]|nr:MAG: hypothetical protein E6I07_13695 [Chloroflexota bacterium]